MSPYVTVAAGLAVGIMLGWTVDVGKIDLGPGAGVVMSEDHARLIEAQDTPGRFPNCPASTGGHCRHFPANP